MMLLITVCPLYNIIKWNRVPPSSKLRFWALKIQVKALDELELVAHLEGCGTYQLFQLKEVHSLLIAIQLLQVQAISWAPLSNFMKSEWMR